MKNNYWSVSNTVLHTWFERDRANVRLESDLGGEIICLWDDEVLQFINDGFHRPNRDHWHNSLVKYANEHDLKEKDV